MRPSWDQYLSTRWEPLDRDHAELSGRLKELLAAVNDGDAERTRAAIEVLLRVSADHFAHEERLMRDNAYPLLARHKEAHDLYLADVAQHAARAATNGLDAELRRWATGRVLEWFRLHVSANDVALGTFLWTLERTSRLRGEAASGSGDAQAKPG